MHVEFLSHWSGNLGRECISIAMATLGSQL